MSVILISVSAVAATTSNDNSTSSINSSASTEVSTSTTSADIQNTTKTNIATTSKTSLITSSTSNSTSAKVSTSNSTSAKVSTNTVVSKNSTKITVNNATLYPYQKYTITATVVSNNKYVNGGIVAFKINGITISHATVVNGKATITYTVPAWAAGNYNVTAIYGGTSSLASSTATNTLKVKEYGTVVYVTSVSTAAGKTVTFKAVVKTTTGAFAKNGTVVFKVNGITIGKSTITNGVATLTYTIPSTWNSNYTITSIYSGSKIYNQSQSTGTLTIKSSPAAVSSPYAKYLVATTNCQSTNSKIVALMKKITANSTNTYAKAVAIFNWVRNNIDYNYYSNTRYGAVGTLTKGSGNCVDTTHLLIALTRAAGIPARYVHAYPCYFESGLVCGHVWAEVYVNGNWYTCDAVSSRNSFGVIKNWYKATIVGRYITLPF